MKDAFKKSDNKIEWIKLYITELHTSFSNIKKFELSENLFAQRLSQLGVPAFIYPFIIKGYKFHEEDAEKLNALFNLLEIVTFRARLINSRANIQERLNAILLSYNGNLSGLLKSVKEKLNESWYWGDANTKNCLNGSMYGNNSLSYVLWRYENSIQNKGYSIRKFSIENEQIEHISPQNPTNGDPIETGYEVDEDNKYSDDFILNKLNCIGNLMLISGSHNASIGNKPFKNKLLTYKKNPLLNQQAEIEKYAKYEKEEPVWKIESIDERHKKIVKFSIDNWSFDSVNIESPK